MVFPCGSTGKESACNVGDLGSIPGLGSSGEEKGYPLQYSGLEDSMGYILHGVTKSLMWLRHFHFLTSIRDYWKNHSFDHTNPLGNARGSCFAGSEPHGDLPWSRVTLSPSHMTSNSRCEVSNCGPCGEIQGANLFLKKRTFNLYIFLQWKFQFLLILMCLFAVPNNICKFWFPWWLRW